MTTSENIQIRLGHLAESLPEVSRATVYRSLEVSSELEFVSETAARADEVAVLVRGTCERCVAAA